MVIDPGRNAKREGAVAAADRAADEAFRSASIAAAS
jgi:hypothetical protein